MLSGRLKPYQAYAAEDAPPYQNSRNLPETNDDSNATLPYAQ
jgi:hypothetical protein